MSKPRQLFYYDSKQRLCRRFLYTGCALSRNRFLTEDKCERHCGDAPPALPRPVAVFSAPEKRGESCETAPCENGGFCREATSGTVVCDCPRGFSGRLCESWVDGWERGKSGKRCVFAEAEGDVPRVCRREERGCRNGGVCAVGSEGLPFCFCPQTFAGPLCQCKRAMDESYD